MNRQLFMNNLKELLQDIPEEERENALQYYQDYFDDAGVFNEEQVIQELVSPERVAATIKADLAMAEERVLENGEYTEIGYSNPIYEEKPYEVSEGAKKDEEKREPETYVPADYSKRNRVRKEGLSGRTILLILACILLIPVLSIGGNLLGGVIGLIGGFLGIIIGLVALCLGLLFGGIGVIISGIIRLFVFPIGGVFRVGVGLIMIGVGAILTYLLVLLILKLSPVLAHLVIKIKNKITNRREEKV